MFFLKCNTVYTERDCSSCPDSPGYACTDDGERLQFLNKTLNLSQTTECESLCKQEGGEGCCYIAIQKPGGCFWKRGASGIIKTNHSEIAVKCTFPGTLLSLSSIIGIC